MNKKLIPFFSLLFFCFSNSLFSQYKISQIVDVNKIKIPPPYKYDGFLMNEFSFELINKEIPIEFIAFKNQKYKLIFCSSNFEEPVMISIYDKANPKVKVAEQIIDAATGSWTFEPTKPGTYSIVYEIPSSNTDIEHKACLVMLIGFTGK
ncbi:hypothetical protein BH10BAC1_BH10BAC1_07970 [soil metagenome]